MDICKEVVCLARRILSEYGMMFNQMMSYPLFPCNWSSWKPNGKGNCFSCPLMDKDILENILICILQVYNKEEREEKFAAMKLSCCGTSNKVKGVGELYPAYWSITALEELEMYNRKCTHVQEVEYSKEYCALCFLVTAVVYCLPSSKEMVNKVFSVFCQRENDGSGLFFMSEADAIVFKEYGEKVKNSSVFFHVVDNELGREMIWLFDRLTFYLKTTRGVYPLGIEMQLIDYLKSVSGDKKTFDDYSGGVA